MVEDPWPNLCNSKGPCVLKFSVQNDRRSLCNHHRSIGSWRSGGAVSPPAASGQRPGGGVGGEASGNSENIVFYSTGKRA